MQKGDPCKPPLCGRLDLYLGFSIVVPCRDHHRRLSSATDQPLPDRRPARSIYFEDVAIRANYFNEQVARIVRVNPRNLTPASGRQDHTTSPSASRALVFRALPRPPHPTARFVTIASAPLVG
jgi:hypothetical protein